MVSLTRLPGGLAQFHVITDQSKPTAIIVIFSTSFSSWFREYCLAVGDLIGRETGNAIHDIVALPRTRRSGAVHRLSAKIARGKKPEINCAISIVDEASCHAYWRDPWDGCGVYDSVARRQSGRFRRWREETAPYR